MYKISVYWVLYKNYAFEPWYFRVNGPSPGLRGLFPGEPYRKHISIYTWYVIDFKAGNV